MTGVRAWLRQADPRYFQIVLISLVLVVGEMRYGILGGYDRLAVALAACLATELALSWFVRGRLAGPQSAIVSGISMALLTKPQGDLLWPFALGGFLAIASKYVLQYRGRHLWNPTNFAISVLLLLAPERVAVLSHQWGNEIWTNVFIWGIGLIVVWRAGVLHLTLAYVTSFIALAMVRCWITGATLLPEVAPITGPMYQLFAFFMVTDPRTTVRTRRGRYLVVVLVALVEAGIRLAADFHLPLPPALAVAPPILALAIVGPIGMWLDLRRSVPGLTPPAPTVPSGVTPLPGAVGGPP